MSTSGQRSLLRNGLLSLWAMATLILFFALAILVYEMIQAETPIQGMLFERDAEEIASYDEDLNQITQDIHVYFGNHEGTQLIPETREILRANSTVENCRRVLIHLIEGPRDLLSPVMSSSTKIRGIYLRKNGELVIDFSRELEAGHIHSASAELLMVRAIVSSVAQPNLRGPTDGSVRSVRFLFEGSPSRETFPVHIDLSNPIIPDRSWIAGVSEITPHG